MSKKTKPKQNKKNVISNEMDYGFILMGASDPYVDQFSGDIFWWAFSCFRKILSEWGVFLFLLEQNVHLKIETYTNLCENIL